MLYKHEIWRVTDVIFIFHFGLFLPFYPSNSPKNQNFTKMKKAPEHIIILHMCTKNHDHKMCSSWDMVRDGWMDRRTDGQTDGWKKWHIEVGAPPNNLINDLSFLNLRHPAINFHDENNKLWKQATSLPSKWSKVIWKKAVYSTRFQPRL